MSAWSSSSVNAVSPNARRTTMTPSSSPELVTGATRIGGSSSGSSWGSSAGSHTRIHAGPETPARAITVSSSVAIGSSAWPRSGTDTARSSTPPDRVQTSARSRSMVFFSDSASWSSSSSSGSARVSRLPKVRIDLVGRVLLAVHAPVRVVLQPLAGRHRTAARRSRRPRSTGRARCARRGRATVPRPRPPRGRRRPTSAASPPNVIVWTSSRSMRTASERCAPSASAIGNSAVAADGHARGAPSASPTSASSTTAPSAIAAAVSTPHAGHCRRRPGGLGPSPAAARDEAGHRDGDRRRPTARRDRRRAARAAPRCTTPRRPPRARRRRAPTAAEPGLRAGRRGARARGAAPTAGSAAIAIARTTAVTAYVGWLAASAAPSMASAIVPPTSVMSAASGSPGRSTDVTRAPTHQATTTARRTKRPGPTDDDGASPAASAAAPMARSATRRVGSVEPEGR